LTRALVGGKVFIPLVFIPLGTRVDLHWFTSGLFLKGWWVCSRPTGLTLDELKAGLLWVGKDQLSLGLLAVNILEPSLKPVW